VTECVYVVGACIVLLMVGTIWLRVRTRRIAASRPGETFDTFRASFAPDDAEPDVLRAVYEKFQHWNKDAVAAFPVRAEDSIYRIYGMVDEDLDDAILDVLAACRRQLRPEEQLRPVVTVRDFVRFVARCPIAADPAVSGRRVTWSPR
jgi:hypothetical protein